MAEPASDKQEFASVDRGQRQLEVVAYLGAFKIVGVAYFGVAQRSTSQRASDYVRQFKESRLTLSKVRVYDRSTQELLETAPFVVVNMDRVDFIYARDEEEPAGDAADGS